jgi:16S rRNA (guanine527-N7)-methyltransferase
MIPSVPGSLPAARICDLIAEYYPAPDAILLDRLAIYLALLVKWNARTNLTSIRDPDEMVRRHFGESLFLAAHLPETGSLLDLGSGAGFPGLPVQLARPGLRVTLAESQNKKAAFLREVVRTLALPTVVWGDRAERLPAELRFDVVALRAVDRPEEALGVARSRLAPAGMLAHLTGELGAGDGAGGRWIPLPGAARSYLHLS